MADGFALNKFTLCWPNRVEEATLSSPNLWVALDDLTLASLGLDNLKDPLYDIQAGTPELTGIEIVATLPKQRRIGCIALARHNLTNAATGRVRIYYDAERTVLQWDSGWRLIWPPIYESDDLDFEDDNFWLGNVADEDRTLFTALATFFADANYLAGCVVVELSDEFNPAEVILIGRLALMEVWQPETNISYGVQFGSEIATTLKRNRSGSSKFFNRKKRERTISAALDWLTEAEAFQKIGRAYQTQGIDREVLVAYQLNQDLNFMDRTFMGQFVDPSPLTHPHLSSYEAPIVVQEQI